MRHVLFCAALVLSACDGSKTTAPVRTSAGGDLSSAASFADDVRFLSKHGEVIVLASPEGAKLALSAKYQGRVMTSAVSAEGRSLGWIHRAFIESGKTGTPFDNFGGEDRFWLGPEGGQFGLYFPKGAPFAFDAWQTPHEMQEGAWASSDDRPGQVTFRKTMTVANWSGTSFTVDVARTIEMLGSDAVRTLGVAGDGPAFVAYQSTNKITNAGKAAWRKESGLLSIWILAMYAPVPDTRVVVPFEKAGGGPVVNDAYFGKVPADRLSVRDGYLVFKCDGTYRSKIGLSPSRARSVLGSYSRTAKLLTVVRYDGPRRSAPYVNSMWEQQAAPYAGDAVNSYNDGSPGPGKPPLGGFYELETSSAAAELAPGESASHTHTTFHFVGEPSALDPIARSALGVSLEDIERQP
jgi:hypothetical protein